MFSLHRSCEKELPLGHLLLKYTHLLLLLLLLTRLASFLSSISKSCEETFTQENVRPAESLVPGLSQGKKSVQYSSSPSTTASASASAFDFPSDDFASATASDYMLQ
jgi:hypothetical protein